MKVLFDKHNFIWHLKNAKAKAALRREARELYAAADSIYWHEMSKPQNERDEQLMSECLATMKQSSAILSWGTNRKAATQPLHGLKLAAATLCAIIVLAAASTGLSLAMGQNIWQVIFGSNKEGITIRGNSTQSAEVGGLHGVDFSSIPAVDGEEFGTIEEVKEKLGVNPLNLDLTKADLMVDNIYVYKDDVMMQISVSYTGDEHYLLYDITLYNEDGNAAFTQNIVGQYENPQRVTVNDIDCYTATGEDNIICYTYEGYVYEISTDMEIDTVLSYINVNE